jgi:hypothetical protein
MMRERRRERGGVESYLEREGMKKRGMGGEVLWLFIDV